MCKNATSTAGSLLAAIRPTIVSLLTLEGLINTPNGVTALKAFDAAQLALTNWVSGTNSQTIIQLINAFTGIFNTLPFSPGVQALVSIIAAGIVVVIGVIHANSPAPVPVGAPAGVTIPADEVQAHHAMNVIEDTSGKVQTLVPTFKRSIFTSVANQYKNTWNKETELLGGQYLTLKQA
jgi:hypothetical protein